MYQFGAQPQLPKPRPVLAWPGGKTRLLKYLLPLVPAHAAYIEVFGGGLALFTAKPPSGLEIVNDINGELVSFYRCCKYHLDPLLDELDLVLNSRQEVADYRAQRGLTELQRAARWFVVNVLSFGGTMTGFRVSRTSALPSRSRRMLAIRSLSHRLDRTCIERLTWEKCLSLYDHPEAFFFLDPPYFDGGGENYAGWSEHELQRFGAAVLALKGRWLLTFQDCPQIREIFAAFAIKTIARQNGIGNNRGRRGRVYREVIITSERPAALPRRKGASA